MGERNSGLLPVQDGLGDQEATGGDDRTDRVQSAAVTTALANTTAPRAGTATVVVRIRPLLYSLTTVRAPTLPATSISAM